MQFGIRNYSTDNPIDKTIRLTRRERDESGFKYLMPPRARLPKLPPPKPEITFIAPDELPEPSLSPRGPWWFPDPQPPTDDQVTINHVMRATAQHFKVSLTDLIQRRRHQDIVWRRHVGVYLSHSLTTRSLPMIGRHWGGIDHTTVIHACRRIEAIKHHPDVQAIKATIRGDIQAYYDETRPDPNQLVMEV